MTALDRVKGLFETGHGVTLDQLAIALSERNILGVPNPEEVKIYQMAFDPWFSRKRNEAFALWESEQDKEVFIFHKIDGSEDLLTKKQIREAYGYNPSYSSSPPPDPKMAFADFLSFGVSHVSVLPKEIKQWLVVQQDKEVKLERKRIIVEAKTLIDRGKANGTSRHGDGKRIIEALISDSKHANSITYTQIYDGIKRLT